jgi:hypothetical protein
MITSRDVGAFAPAPFTIKSQDSRSERILLATLAITILSSSFVLIETSPHDGLMVLLAVAVFVGRIQLDRVMAIPFLCLLIWSVAGMAALFNVPGDEKAIQYVLTSVYLAVATIVFTCLFTTNVIPKLRVLRFSYICAALEPLNFSPRGTCAWSF